jgi:Trk K+ transport system NAD-binding subunit
VLAVDSDPDRVRAHSGEGFELRYGDAEDPEFVRSLPLDRVHCVVNTLRDRHVNRALLHGIQRSGSRPRVVLTADTEQEAEALRGRGADIALVPYSDAARDAADRILARAEPGPMEA